MAQHPFLRSSAALVIATLLASCSAGTPSNDDPVSTTDGLDAAASGFAITAVAQLDQPWAMTFLPDGDALVTEKGGTLQRVDADDGSTTEVGGVPDVVDAGQGGLGDVIVAPTFAEDQGIYLSWVERGPRGTGAVIGRATLTKDRAPMLENLTIIWRQDKSSGDGHFSHRMAISPDGEFLFVTSGERQQKDPAQDLTTNLGKVLRLTLGGTPAEGNPFGDHGGVTAEIWSYGHRNPLGIAFDEGGRLWASEMGPRGGDELNLIREGMNYGWPAASNGSDYSGADIPDHTNGDGFEAPAVWWTPSISPGSLMIYTGRKFAAWRGDAFLGALSGEALIRVDLDGTTARYVDRWEMDQRIREVEQDADGSIWLLEDGPGGRLLKLTPA